MKIITLTRRQFLSAAGVSVSSWLYLREAQGLQFPNFEPDGGLGDGPTIRTLRRLSDSLSCFDPVGLYVEPGETIRVFKPSVSTLTAYHPQNENRELRIPETAEPFDLGYLSGPFHDLKLEVEGTYDYFSKFHEMIGMVGRIVVGRPGGPGEKPWGYGSSQGRNPIYDSVLKTAELLDSQEIVKKKAIPFPFDDMIPDYPLWD